jgi:ABC-2 type transport system ATP-binding protein
MTYPIDITDLHVHYGATHALDGVTVAIDGGVICGLLGRNGAGKSTLLATVAAYRRPTRGTVRVDGEDPYENAPLVNDICLVNDKVTRDDSKVDHVLEIAGLLQTRWDGEYARRLLDRFEIPRRTKVGQLSRGQRSALAVTVGLASRAPVTLFDEPHLGMDAAARQAFYDELLTDYIASPRTIVLSTHLIDEVAALLEDVIIIDHGRLLTHERAETLRQRGAELTGPAAAIDALTAPLHVVSERTLGRTKSVVVVDDIDDSLRREARAAGVDLGPIPLQTLFVHLTSQETTP